MQMGMQGRQPYIMPYPMPPMPVRMQQPLQQRKTKKQTAKQPATAVTVLPPSAMPGTQDQNLILQQLKSLSEESFELFSTLFEVPGKGRRDDKIAKFTTTILPQIFKANSKIYLQSIFTILDILNKGTPEKLHYFSQPKIPEVFKSAPGVKTTYRLLALHPAKFEFVASPKDRPPDSYVIGQFLPWPMKSPADEVLIVDGTPCRPVNFGESENFYVIADPEWNGQKRGLSAVFQRNDALVWFVMNIVVENKDLAREICQRRGRTLEEGQRALVSTSKCEGCQPFDLETLISDTVRMGSAVCPHCKEKILLNELFIESIELGRPCPIPSMPNQPLIIPNLAMPMHGPMVPPMPDETRPDGKKRQVRQSKAKVKRTASLAQNQMANAPNVMPVNSVMEPTMDMMFPMPGPGPMRPVPNQVPMKPEIDKSVTKRRTRSSGNLAELGDGAPPKEIQRGRKKEQQEVDIPVSNTFAAGRVISTPVQHKYEPIQVPNETPEERAMKFRMSAFMPSRLKVYKEASTIGDRIFNDNVDIEEPRPPHPAWSDPDTAEDYLSLIDSFRD